MVTEKNNTFYFTPEDPGKILYLLEEEKKQITEKEKLAHGVIGDLKHMMNPYTAIPKVQFYEGVEGVIRLYDDILAAGEDIYGASVIGQDDVHPEVMQYLNEIYTPKRKEMKNKSFMIYDAGGEDLKSYLDNDKAMRRTTLLVPKEEYPFDTCFHIYGNKVAFYSRSNNELMGVLIESKHIRNNQYSLFKLAWNYAKSFPINRKYSSIDLS